MEETLGKRIGLLRREKGITQEALSEKLGVTPQAVSKWETDASCPDIALLPELARLLGVSTDELLSGKKTENAMRLLPPEERKPLAEMMLRLVVDTAEGDKVRINLPMALVQMAVEFGMDMPQINGVDALRGVDLAQILRLVEQGAAGNLLEVETSEGDLVRIFVE